MRLSIYFSMLVMWGFIGIGMASPLANKTDISSKDVKFRCKPGAAFSPEVQDVMVLDAMVYDGSPLFVHKHSLDPASDDILSKARYRVEGHVDNDFDNSELLVTVSELDGVDPERIQCAIFSGHMDNNGLRRRKRWSFRLFSIRITITISISFG